MFEDLLQPTHLLLIFIIVMLVFGPQKLPQVGKGLGEAIRGFREGIRSNGKQIEQGTSQSETPPPPEKHDEVRAS